MTTDIKIMGMIMPIIGHVFVIMDTFFWFKKDCYSTMVDLLMQVYTFWRNYIYLRPCDRWSVNDGKSPCYYFVVHVLKSPSLYANHAYIYTYETYMNIDHNELADCSFHALGKSITILFVVHVPIAKITCIHRHIHICIYNVYDVEIEWYT